MKTLKQIREEIELAELKADQRKIDILKTGIGSRAGHSGHEGGEFQHDQAAKQHKGTEAGKHHERAAQHHGNALSALNKGNLSSSHEHSKLAASAAKKAERAGGEKTDSGVLHKGHEIAHQSHQNSQRIKANSLSNPKNRKKQDKPVARAVGQVKTKIKRALRMGEEVEQVDQIREQSNLLETTWAKDVGRDSKALVAAAKKNGLKAKATGNKVTITGDKKMITKTMLGMRYAYQAYSKGFKEDTSDAVKAFLAKGGKIKKLPPAKAQGYHGKDDPGQDMHGMLDRPDTKKSVIGTRKKAKSMGKNEAMIIRSKKPASKLRRDAESRPDGVREISKGMAGRYLKKVPASSAQAGDMMARPTPGAPGSAAKMDKGVKKFVKRTKGAAMAADKLTGKAKVPAK